MLQVIIKGIRTSFENVAIVDVKHDLPNMLTQKIVYKCNHYLQVVIRGTSSLFKRGWIEFSKFLQKRGGLDFSDKKGGVSKIGELALK